MKRILLKTGISVLVLTMCLGLLQRLLVPKYITEAQEGRLIEEYYQSGMKHDVVFIGDCEVYENFDPVVLWDEYGIPSFIRGSPQQLIWHSYYLMEETLKYETPDVIVFNVLSMKYDTPQSEPYNRLTVDGMRPSMIKWKAAWSGMFHESTGEQEKESFISYFFPLLRFHSRWSDLNSYDFKYWLKDTPQLSVNGYLPRIDVQGTDFFPKGQQLADYQFAESNYEYLDKMTQLCKDHNVELILIKAPSTWPYYYPEWDEQMVAYAEKNDLTYINFLDYVDEIGIDFMTDTYDKGLHLNSAGAEKLSRYFGKILKGQANLPDRRSENEYVKSWEAIKAFRDERITAQEEYLKSHETLKDFYKDTAK